jgi:polygalacturonase
MKRTTVGRPVTRRTVLKLGAHLASTAALAGCALTDFGKDRPPAMREFNVRDYGAVGDGRTLDTAAIQAAVDAAAAAVGPGALPVRVVVPGGRKYHVGTVVLKPGIDFHLADDAELFISINPTDYHGEAAVVATGAQGLKITGTGSINGRSPEIMTQFDQKDEWWFPIPRWRPRLVVLTACNDLEIHNVTLKQAPLWTLHMVGCERVLIDGLKIRNALDVPNCDGIDPDHCRDVEIRNCDIVCGDDAIVLKATRQAASHGPCARIHVKDCVLETQDSGLKIGTETVSDIHDVTFERCTIKSGCRGMCIQLRDEGSVYDIRFKDIRFTSRYHSDPWWGRGEAISLTAIPRAAEGKIGTIHDIRFENIVGRAENSVRVDGSAQSRIRNVTMEKVAVTLERWTKYKGGMFDNRPTKAQADIEPHGTPGFCVRHADDVALRDCRVAWGGQAPDYFTHALEAEDVTGLTYPGFQGTAAHPGRDEAISIR